MVCDWVWRSELWCATGSGGVSYGVRLGLEE